MFSLEGKNKLGIISSFLYFVVMFIVQLIYFIGYSYVVNYNIMNYISAIIILFMVFALVKDFFSDRSLATVLIGVFLFCYPVAPLLFYYFNLSYGVYSIINFVSIVGVVLLMSLRLFKSTNIGKIVGLMGVVYIPIFLLKMFGVYLGEHINYTIYSLWTAVYNLIPAGIFFSYFLFYEKA